MKKANILSLGLALLLMLSLVLTAAPAAQAAEYDSAGATGFTFSDSGIQVTAGSYSGYSVSGTALTISDAGTYVVSGSCADGSIKIKKGTTGVTLVLKGLTLTSSNTAPIACNKSTEVTIVAASGTANTLTDAAYNNDDNHPANTDAENAVIKCKDGSQVTICGSGTLNINANGKNGIKSGSTTEAEGEAGLTIRDVTLNIKAAVNDGINAEQLLTLSGGKITVDAADDGIHCDYVMNIGAENTAGPTISITNCTEGIEAATLNVASGVITIHAKDDCMNAANADLKNYAFSLNISGGALTMDTTGGDGIDSNGTVTISGGTVAVWTASTSDNQPLDADGGVTITGGTVLAAGGSSGMGLRISASQPYVAFGGGGSMGGGMKGGFGGQRGTDGQTKGSFDGGMRGGKDLQFGGQKGTPSDMTTLPQTQPDALTGATATTNGQSAVSIASGSAFSIKSASGAALYSGTAACNARYVLFSSDKLTSGDSYTLCSGTTELATAAAQTGAVSDEKAGQQAGIHGQQSGVTDQKHQNTGAQSSAFTDVVPNAWYADAVRYVTEKGLMSGTGGSQFSLYGATTRGMVMTILARHAGVDTDGGSVWYQKGMNWSAEQGISDGSDPNGNITREQFVTMLWRYAGSPESGGSLSQFTDADSVSSYAVSAMRWAVETGIVVGSDGKLDPKSVTTRAEAATLLMRFCEAVAK